MTHLNAILIFAGLAFAVPSAFAQTSFETGRRTIRSMAGCYLVDYSYTEVESLKDGYVLDKRVYDVNKNKSVKEWIYAEDISSSHLRLQHVLFATDLAGNFIDGSELRHQAEDWEYEAPFLYDFTAPLKWEVKKDVGAGTWTRRVTNLDDGLRYQCAAPWSTTTANPEWSCSNYAPIPGRETRDMGRKDYNTLQRTTRIISYGTNWLERQDNVKTIHKDGVRTPLAREAGKNWYVRLPDSECEPIRGFTGARKDFWNLLRATWAEVLIGDRPFYEKVPTGAPPRFVKMGEIEDFYLKSEMNDEELRKVARSEILKVIGEYRAN